MLNSTHIQKKIEQGWRLKNLVRKSRGNPKNLANSLYLTILSRYPTEFERQAVEDYFKTKDIKFNQAAIDLAWALINSKEFLYRH